MSIKDRTTYTVETCYTCKREGWKREHRPQLMLPDEQAELFGKENIHRKTVEPVPEESIICWGGHGTIHQAVTEAIALSKVQQRPIAFDFNERTVVCYPWSDFRKVVDDWWVRIYGRTEEEDYKKNR